MKKNKNKGASLVYVLIFSFILSVISSSLIISNISKYKQLEFIEINNDLDMEIIKDLKRAENTFAKFDERYFDRDENFLHLVYSGSTSVGNYSIKSITDENKTSLFKEPLSKKEIYPNLIVSLYRNIGGYELNKIEKLTFKSYKDNIILNVIDMGYE